MFADHWDAADPIAPPRWWGEDRRFALLVLEDCARILFPSEETPVGYHDTGDIVAEGSDSEEEEEEVAPPPAVLPKKRSRLAGPRQQRLCKICRKPRKGHSRGLCHAVAPSH